MASLKPNIVQAEFFHVGGDPDSPIQQVLADAWSRTADGLKDILAGMDPDEVKTGIKTCVRFYDYSGSITQSVLLEERAEADRIEVAGELEKKHGLIRRYLLYQKLKRLSSEMVSAPKQRHILTINAVAKVLKERSPVAVEFGDHRFRPVRDNEAHELLEAIRASKSSWIFCFRHNQLLADENVKVTKAF
jgi:hypothetical protein